MSVDKFVSKISYYYRLVLRTWLCHYRNIFPNNLNFDLIDAHRDQQKSWDDIVQKGDQIQNQLIYDKKAELKLDLINFTGLIQ